MKISLLATALFVGASLSVTAQTQTQNTSNGVSSKSGQSTGSAEGLNRKGTGQESPKMKSGVSRNGNSNLSPTSPTNTHGSTSQGSASVRSTGGAEGSGTKMRGGVKGAQNARNNTANDGGTTGPGATNGNSNRARTSEASTSGSTGGSKRPTSTAATQKEARTSDRNVSTGYPEPTGAGKPGTPAGNAKGNKVNGGNSPH
jgi:hypothetical protein